MAPANPSLISSQRVLSHVVDQDPAGAGLDGEGERVAQAERPDRPVLAAGRVIERIVVGDRPVGVEPQQLALEGRHRLRRHPGRLFAQGNVELAVLAEMDRTALVPGGHIAAELRLVVPFEQDDLAARYRDVAPGGEAADAVVDVRAGRHVADVDVAVVGEVRVEGHADQPALPVAVHLDGHKWLRQERPVFDHPEGSRLLADENRGRRGRSPSPLRR